MKGYLQSNASEVRNMLFTEWNMSDAKKVWQEEAQAAFYNAEVRCGC
jgi:hypothetical protein